MKLKIVGTDLNDRVITYAIYDQGHLVKTFTTTSTSNTENTFDWVVGDIDGELFPGQYRFVAILNPYDINRTSDNTITVPELSDAFFTNLQDAPISESGLNSLVKLNISGVDLATEDITYEIWEEDGGFLFFDKKVFTTSSDVFSWRAGTDSDGNVLGGGTYYFIAKTDDAAPTTGSVIKSITGNAIVTEKRSLDLIVSDTENNIPPVARITGPEDKQIYFINESLSFTQASFDDDDPFSYRWELGDGTIKEGNSTNLIDFNFFYGYNGEENLGQQTIRLTVTDERGLSDTDIISILVINSTFLLAYVDSPVSGSEYGRVVSYDARSTYAVSSVTAADGCTKTITCEAGNCPGAARGHPPCYPAGSAPIVVQNSPATPGAANYDDINFCWEFDDGLSGNLCATGTTGAVFDKPFSFVGRHTSTLVASINPTSQIEQEFDIFFDADTCIVVDDTNTASFPGLDLGLSYWKSSGSLPADSRNDCNRVGGINLNGDPRTTCCPNGYTCGNDGECLYEPRNRCSDFTTQSDCEDLDDGHTDLAALELITLINEEFPGGCRDYNAVYGELCYEYLDCNCEWDNTNNACNPSSNHKLGKISAGTIENWDFASLPSNAGTICTASSSSTSGRCTFDFTYEGSCLDGDEFITRRWTAFYEDSAAASNDLDYCQDGSEIIPCERVVRLNFFGIQNLVVAIILIIIIYYFWERKKK